MPPIASKLFMVGEVGYYTMRRDGWHTFTLKIRLSAQVSKREKGKGKGKCNSFNPCPFRNQSYRTVFCYCCSAWAVKASGRTAKSKFRPLRCSPIRI